MKAKLSQLSVVRAGATDLEKGIPAEVEAEAVAAIKRSVEAAVGAWTALHVAVRTDRDRSKSTPLSQEEMDVVSGKIADAASLLSAALAKALALVCTCVTLVLVHL